MSGTSVNKLQARSDLLRRLREFFYDRGFLEVETPLLLNEVIPEQHIEPLAVSDVRAGGASTQRPPTANRAMAGGVRYLQASPELCMKQLMADGAEAIFQITRSFRAGEKGKLHRPEFTIVEWYRRGDDVNQGMALLDELCQTMLDAPPAERLSYREAFDRHVGVCPLTNAASELAARCRELGIAVPVGMPEADQDSWLELLLTLRVEPHLGQNRPTILYDYPASQASLAKIRDDGDGPAVAERFELYVRGVELANGFHELTDAAELRARLQRVNDARVQDGRQPLPLPESLLTAMERGLPDCTGVALGFDRLLMLAVGAESIEDVIE